jgi:(heptosyl)LPS beta-1,4-glucosyltransferase
MISAVINTLNEEKNLERCLKCLSWVDEIVVCDDGSVDRTVEIAKQFGAKIYHHKFAGFVEAARNFAIEKAMGGWILVVDADEEIPSILASKLKEIANTKFARAKKMLRVEPDFVRISRKNIIFGKWVRHSGWWPDYNVRFFKKGKVKWQEKIHEVPKTEGRGFELEAKEGLAIVHYNYNSIGQFLDRLNRYTEIEAQDLIKEGYKFDWRDLISKPTGEFLSRFFARQGYKDGLHGLVLAVLQSFSFFVAYLKVWEREGFKEQEVTIDELKEQISKKTKETRSWFLETLIDSASGLRKVLYRIKRKLQ